MKGNPLDFGIDKHLGICQCHRPIDSPPRFWLNRKNGTQPNSSETRNQPFASEDEERSLASFGAQSRRRPQSAASPASGLHWICPVLEASRLSTGWILELESAVTVDGKPVNSILVSYRKTAKLEKLENTRVRVTGKIAHRHEVEKGDHLVLDISSIKEVKATAQSAPEQPVSIQKIAVAGKLARAMAIGGESTGWVLELESTTTIDGKQVNSIQVSYGKTEQLENWKTHV